MAPFLHSSSQTGLCLLLCFKPSRVCPHKTLHVSVCSSIVYGSQRVETTPMLITVRMDKKDRVSPHQGVLFGCKKE